VSCRAVRHLRVQLLHQHKLLRLPETGDTDEEIQHVAEIRAET
jgi:hypothetical protein